MTMRDTVVKRLSELAEKDKRIILITGDLGFGVLTDFAVQFPRQFLNVGVAEQNMTGIAAGMAKEGYIVFTYSIGNFPTLRCLEQLRNDVCYHGLNVNVIAVGGGFSYGPLGMSHHATEDLSIMRALPNISVIAPSDPWQAEFAVDSMVVNPGPCYLRVDKGKANLPAKTSSDFRYGKIRTVRKGNAVTLIAIGSILKEAYIAAEQLETQGIDARILEVHTLKPLDVSPILKAAQETAGLITIEENTVLGGLGGAVAEACMEGGVSPGFFKRMGLDDQYSSIVGSQDYLRAHYGLDHKAIMKQAHSEVALPRLNPDTQAGAKKQTEAQVPAA